MPLDNTLTVSPNQTGHRFHNKFMMYVCVYNHILNRITHNITWKDMYLDLLDEIMRWLTAIYAFFIAAIWNPPKLCLSGIRQFMRFCIYSIRQPGHCLVYIVINYYQLITLITLCHLIFIRCEMLYLVVSVGLCFEFDERGALGQVQAFRELICKSENIEAEI